MIQGLKISATGRHGFRRLNRHWPKEGAVVALAEFTEAELQTLNDEPNLVMANADIEELKDAKLDDLKAFAEARGIDLGKASKLEEITKLLENPKAEAKPKAAAQE